MTSNDVSVTGDGTAVLSAGDRSSAKSPGYSDLTAPVPVHPRWEPLAEPETIDDVLGGIDQVLDWSIKEKSTIGYFAVLYKRVTLGIRQAIIDGEFDDGARIGRLDVAFARRYFNALNAYFYPDEYDGLTLPWEVAFVGDPNHEPTILQHMMAG